MLRSHSSTRNADPGIVEPTPDRIRLMARDLAASNQTVAQFVDLVEKLAVASDLGQILNIVSRAARRLHSADAATIILREGQDALYAAEDAEQPLWPRLRLPLDDCISGWVMNQATAVSIFDVNKDSRI